MDDLTKRLVERTKQRQEAIRQQKRQISEIQRKRRPLAPQNNEGNMSDECEIDVTDVPVTESPNKRSKIDLVEDSENANAQRSASDSDIHCGKGKSSTHVNLRMQKLLNQRKIWEAEEKGENVSFNEMSLPSPVRHDSAPAAPENQPCQQKKNTSLEHEGRKRRLAALAARVKGWEDDISRHDPPKTSEEITTPVLWKPPTGRIQVMSSTPVEKPVAEQAVSPQPKVSRQDDDSLSVEGLVKFAVVGKAAERKSPAKKVSQQKSSIVLGENAKTALQTSCQTIAVESMQGMSEETKELMQTSKTLQQRMLDLQNNGITKADLSAMNTSSANTIMERARAEREKELEELRSMKLHAQKTQNMTKKEKIVDGCDDTTEKKGDMDEDSERSCSNDVENRSQIDDEVYTSAFEKPQSEMDGDEEDEDGQELSYSDSMLDEESTVNEESKASGEAAWCVRSCKVGRVCDGVGIAVEAVEEKLSRVTVSEEKTNEEDLTGCDDEEAEMSDRQMIDDMFEGVLSCDEEDMFTPPRTDSPLTISSLTRQKSRLEVKCELNVRKKTCNEAEDTHTLSQPSKFQKTCLSRSNSTESIVSLCQESDFPMYTISAYRTDKRRQSARFDKKVVRNEAEAAKESMLKRQPEKTVSTQDMIDDMMEQVSRQQRVIQQASAALNCCYDAHHGKGTVTEVEAEKLLLISSEKRLALLSEIQTLKQKKTAKLESPYRACTGAIIINNIRLPLRTEYIFSLANKREAGDIRNHYYFVLARRRHHMFATQLVSTLDDLSGDSLVFKDQFKIDDLKSDFKITLEVFSMNHRTRPDGVPMQDKSKGKLSGILHKKKPEEVKKVLSDAVEKTKLKVKKAAAKNTGCSIFTQQNLNDSIQSLTPKKLRSAKRSSHIPSMMSPSGPNAIRISNFSLIGSTTITLKDITERKFALQKVPFLSPISGQIYCKLAANFHSAVEQRGFLTMFDDVGGLGAWHRRWCALRQGRLYSWTYPDDENNKKPLMVIAMRECISRECATVERIMCARPNTFELRTMRPRRQGDKQNLISEDTGSVITTKHWLSADIKEERIAWIDSLNQALADVRAWDTEALKPFK